MEYLIRLLGGYEKQQEHFWVKEKDSGRLHVAVLFTL